MLLEQDLGVLVDGVREGRQTFANTLKYVFMATSANFGNMFSMAGASLFLPFLPLLPKQILLINLLTDFPEMTIATDSVDPEMVQPPRRWDIHFIRRFMLVFGLRQLGLRLPDLWRRCFWSARDRRAISHRLVHRVGHLGRPDRAGRAQSPPVFQKPAEQTSRAGHGCDRVRNGGNAISAVGRRARVSAFADVFLSHSRSCRDGLRCDRRTRQVALLSA